MNTKARQISVSGLRVEVVRKDIKNLHLGVYPPNGRVRVAAPLVVSDDAVRLAVIDKLGWIRRQQAKFVEQPRQSAREMVNGESQQSVGMERSPSSRRVGSRRIGWLKSGEASTRAPSA